MNSDAARAAFKRCAVVAARAAAERLAQYAEARADAVWQETPDAAPDLARTLGWALGWSALAAVLQVAADPRQGSSA